MNLGDMKTTGSKKVHQPSLYRVDTADGRNPAPVEVGSLSHYLKGFTHPRWLALGFLPSTVTR